MKNEDEEVARILSEWEKRPKFEFDEVWMHNISNYLLVKVPFTYPDGSPRYLVFQIDISSAIVIENDEEAYSIKQAMLKKGVRVVDEIPDKYCE